MENFGDILNNPSAYNRFIVSNGYRSDNRILNEKDEEKMDIKKVRKKLVSIIDKNLHNYKPLSKKFSGLTELDIKELMYKATDEIPLEEMLDVIKLYNTKGHTVAFNYVLNLMIE